MATSTQEMLDYWKAQLGLHSWDIRVKTEPKGEREGNAEGFVRPQIERADLTIFWGDEESCPFELTLLHELVHIRLWAIDPHDAEGALHLCREAAIEWLARALYVARHGVAPWASPFEGGGEE